jgi:hypothetical protein
MMLIMSGMKNAAPVRKAKRASSRAMTTSATVRVSCRALGISSVGAAAAFSEGADVFELCRLTALSKSIPRGEALRGLCLESLLCRSTRKRMLVETTGLDEQISSGKRLHLLLYFLRFLLDLLAALFDILAGALNGVTANQRHGRQRREAEQ